MDICAYRLQNRCIYRQASKTTVDVREYESSILCHQRSYQEGRRGKASYWGNPNTRGLIAARGVRHISG
jgi:hypothetical protein